MNDTFDKYAEKKHCFKQQFENINYKIYMNLLCSKKKNVMKSKYQKKGFFPQTTDEYVITANNMMYHPFFLNIYMQK